MLAQEIETKILEICKAEGIFKEKMEKNIKFHFALKVVYPPWHPQPKNLLILMPKNKHYVSIELATKISPEHLDTFKKMEGQGMNFIPLFYHLLRNLLLNRNLFFTFNLKNHSYIISEHIYEDRLFMDIFYRRMRKVYYASLSAQLILSEILSGKFKGIQLPPMKMDSSDESDGAPEDLYYS
ncbi:MAG: DUF2299 family protein [Candidatus Lokiarchaeota archaeon]|nr:DUF2299 family protein [Candidatus Lokiarchaeota archaeon]